MSSNSGGGGGIWLIILLFMFFLVLIYVGIGIYFMLMFLAFSTSILCLVGSFVEFPISRHIYFEKFESRMFLLRGVVGAGIMHVFLKWASWYFKVGFAPWVWEHAYPIGYIIGSIGIAWLDAKIAANGGGDTYRYVEPLPSLPVHSAPAALPAPRQALPHRFAEWNDEEERG